MLLFEDIFCDLRLDLRGEIMHPHEIEYPEQALVVMMFNVYYFGEQLVLHIDQQCLLQFFLLYLHDGLEQSEYFG